MSLGTRVRLIASTAHRLVVERSYIHKVLIYASLQIVSNKRFPCNSPNLQLNYTRAGVRCRRPGPFNGTHCH